MGGNRLDPDAEVVTRHVRSFLRGSKDAAIALSARAFLNNKLRGIGEMTELSIDTKKRAIRVRLELVGETEPVEIHIKEYDLSQSGRATTITIMKVAASREWLQEALRQFAVGRSFTIPPQAAAILNLLT